MILSPRRLLAAFAGLSLIATALPASAQWFASGRWGTERNWRYVTPGTWLVLREDNPAQPVSIHAEGANHVGRIAIWCTPGTQDSTLQFDSYFGDALRQPIADTAANIVANTAPEIVETVAFVIDGQRFERQFHFDMANRFWTAHQVLDSAFLDAFSWGSRMQLLNAEGTEITSYRLNGSGTAREALRRACQL